MLTATGDALKGRSILVVEDEPLISLDLSQLLLSAGAEVHVAETVKDAIKLIEDGAIEAGIIDHCLRDEDSSPICAHLNLHGIPFIIYSGVESLPDACKRVPFLTKPADPQRLTVALANAITGSM